MLVEYIYDAYGVPTTRFTGITDSLSDTEKQEIYILGSNNPFRYRGYYYDTETGFYYLNSRYYDPQISRWINADTTDVLTATLAELTDKNLFAYCDNSPVTRVDYGGQFWDVIFDAVSIVVGVIEVVKNPSDIQAWVGLAVDIACAVVPGLTGGGAIVDAVTKSDEVLDTAKAIYKAPDKASDIRKATGSYEILYKSGNTYVGKGGFSRALKLAERNAKKHLDEVVSISWKSAPNARTAFINEYKSMCKYGGPNNRQILNRNSYNKIWSPGRKYYFEDFGHYYTYGGKIW